MACYLIGCSGWSYPWWKGTFYPAGTRQGDQLAYYAQHFPTVEVNMTFYRFPTTNSIDSWRMSTPEGFVFAAKMNRGITHYRKLRGVEDLVDPFISLLDELGEKLGPILVQLPPGLGPDLGLMESFLASLPPRSYAFEFRDREWLRSSTYHLLERYNAAVVMADPPPLGILPVTADFAYIRWHGRSGPKYEYGREELERWADFMDSLSLERVYGYFNNDQGGAAPRDANALTGLLTEKEACMAR